VFGGMLAATILGLVLVPVFYAVIENLREGAPAKAPPKTNDNPGLGTVPGE
jgi:hydrophobic/amphiphilic exporter-1 (mainly G- bacteria), HAE1 family